MRTPPPRRRLLPILAALLIGATVSASHAATANYDRELLQLTSRMVDDLTAIEQICASLTGTQQHYCSDLNQNFSIIIDDAIIINDYRFGYYFVIPEKYELYWSTFILPRTILYDKQMPDRLRHLNTLLQNMQSARIQFLAGRLIDAYRKANEIIKEPGRFQ